LSNTNLYEEISIDKEFDAKQKPENMEKLENVKIKKNNDKNSKLMTILKGIALR
jgi:translation initiation factor 1 (eIF-1/SUI1)